ncbi:trimethylguanosine synthase, partial [Phenoliferia sp. Uapishka_3]
MRHGAKQNAISNSPVVRALLKPVHVQLPTPLQNATTASAQSTPPPTKSHLISTQPLPAAVSSMNAASTTVVGKRKRDEADEGEERAPVEVNYTVQNLPDELRKYWAQRYRLFSLFDEGCQMDLEGWYSVTPENIAAQIAERCLYLRFQSIMPSVASEGTRYNLPSRARKVRSHSIFDLRETEFEPPVIAIDISPVRLACAKRNAEIYGVADRITFVLGDFVSWSKDYVSRKAAGSVEPTDEVEVVFLSPPWGGIDYRELTGPATTDSPAAKRLKAASTPIPSTPTPSLPPSKPAYPLSALAPLPGDQLFTLARAITPHVAYYLPRNVDIEEIAKLPWIAPRTDQVDAGLEKVEVEEEWMGSKMKAVTVYYGDLAGSPTS